MENGKQHRQKSEAVLCLNTSEVRSGTHQVLLVDFLPPNFFLLVMTARMEVTRV